MKNTKRLLRGHITYVVKKGRNISSTNLNMKVYLVGKLSTPIISISKKIPFLFTIVVSKKVSKSAVKRNTIKRRIRHIIQKHIQEMPTKWVCVFFLKKGIIGKSFQDTEKEILNLVKKVT